MFQGSIWSSIRMLVHIYAMYIGGALGVRITIAAQFLCLLGSPGGFMLATNSALMETVPPAERTAMFGMLGGAQMAGYGTGLVLGGTLYTYLGLYGPFSTAFVMLVLVVLLGLAIIPYHPPAHKRLGADGKPAAKPSALSALKMFRPMRDAHGRRSWTLPCLIFGVVMASLATGYVPIALQLTGQDLFGFEPNMTSAMLVSVPHNQSDSSSATW
jgi:MFS family permease